MSNFYVGQKVVCVDVSNRTGVRIGVNTVLKVGRVYTVNGIRSSPCCGNLIIDVGVTSDADYTTCSACRHTSYYHKVWWMSANRFRPLDSLTEQIERIESEGAPVELEPQYA